MKKKEDIKIPVLTTIKKHLDLNEIENGTKEGGINGHVLLDSIEIVGIKDDEPNGIIINDYIIEDGILKINDDYPLYLIKYYMCLKDVTIDDSKTFCLGDLFNIRGDNDED